VPQSRLMRLELRVSPLTFENRAKHWGFFLPKNSTWKRCGSVPTAPSGTFWAERSSGNRFCAKIYPGWCPVGNRPSSLAATLSAIRHCWPIVVFQSRYLWNGKIGFQYRATDQVVPQNHSVVLSIIPENGGETINLPVYKFDKCGGVTMAMYNTDEVLFYRFSIVWKFPDICLFIMWNFYCNIA